MTEQDEDIYVTSKYIDKKPEISLKKENNFIEDRLSHSYGHSKKNSIHSIVSNNGSMINNGI